MQLAQLFWEEQNKLLFQFKSDEHEIDHFLQKDIKNINIKYELSKKEERAPYIIQEPFLISIKNFHFSANILTFSIQLGSLPDINNLQINIIRLTIFYYSGNREEIFINKTYHLSEISYNNGDLIEITEEELVYETKTRYSVKKRSLNKTHPQKRISKPVLNNNEIKKKEIIKPIDTLIHQPKNMTISVSYNEYIKWFEIKEDKSWDTTLFMVRNEFNKIKELKREIKTLNSTIRKIALKNSSNAVAPIYLQAPGNMMGLPNNLNPPKDTIPSRNFNTLPLNEINAQKVLGNENNARNLSGQIQLMKEMKEKFSSVNNVKDLLTKVPKEELNKNRAKTDHLAFLEFKQNGSKNKIKEERKILIKKIKELGCKDKLKNNSLEELREKMELLTKKN